MTEPAPRCCVLADRPDRPDLDRALLALRSGRPDAESLNALHRRTGIRKANLIHHRDVCLLPGSPPGSSQDPGIPRTGSPATEPTGSPFDGLVNPGDDEMLTPRKIVTAALEEEVLEMRIACKSFAAIAMAKGIAADTAREMVERRLRKSIGRGDRKAELAREMEVQRCDAIIASFWDRATDPEMAKVDVPANTESGVREYDGQDKAADRLLKAMDRKAKLLGLDAPSTIRVSFVDDPEFPAFIDLVISALRDEPAAKTKVLASMRGFMHERRAENAIRIIPEVIDSE